MVLPAEKAKMLKAWERLVDFHSKWPDHQWYGLSKQKVVIVDAGGWNHPSPVTDRHQTNWDYDIRLARPRNSSGQESMRISKNVCSHKAPLSKVFLASGAKHSSPA